MKKFRRIVCLLLIFSMLLPLTGCSSEDLEEIAKKFLREAAKEAANDAIDDVKSNIDIKKDAFLEKGEGVQDSLKTTEVQPPRYEAGYAACDHSVPTEYVEVDGKITLECSCGSTSFQDVDFETFKKLLPAYTILDKILDKRHYATEEIYQLSKYALYRGISPFELVSSKDSGVSCKAQIIHYDANGGEEAPEDQFFRAGKIPKLSEERPVRTGYHFIGWVKEDQRGKTICDGKNLDLEMYYPGKKADSGGQKVKESVTLYALWAEDGAYLYGAPFLGHTYYVEKKRVLVNVKCSCGTPVTDRSITKDQFRQIVDNSNYRKDDLDNLYDCYRLQDAGLVALYFNTGYYKKGMNVSDLYDSVMGIGEGIYAFENIELDPYTFYRNTMVSDGSLYAAKVESLFDGTGAVSSMLLTVSTYKLSKSINGVLEGGNDCFDRARQMLDVVSSVIGFTDASWFVNQFFIMMREGLDLAEACENNRKRLYNTMDTALEGVNNQSSLYISRLFGKGGDGGLKLAEILSQSRNDNWEKMAKAPSLYETICYMKQAEILGIFPDEKDKELFLQYLADRSRYELYTSTGVTYNDYLALMRENW